MTDTTDLTDLQERIAHLTRANDDLSSVVAEQAAKLATLERRVQMLWDHAATQDGSDDTAPPPHY